MRRSIDIIEKVGDQGGVCFILSNITETLCLLGALRDSEVAARRALLLARQLLDQREEATSLYFLGLTLAVRGEYVDSAKTLDRSLAFEYRSDGHVPNDYQAMRAIWLGEYAEADIWANRAMTFCQQILFEKGMIRAVRLQGAAALGLGNLVTAEERLHHALARARTVNLVEEELPALVGLAELRRRHSDFKAACELLDDVWEAAERGPFRLFHADAFNVLAQIERDVGNREAAVRAATEAYRLAWCDGPPFAYHWGLQKARAHLAALDAPEPVLPPFDESKYEPMPEVEIEPADEQDSEN
jgi:tetratricopeptide (TPR) repeat protein